MKITNEHYQQLAALVAPLDTPELRQAYREGQYPRAERTRDVYMRYRWDLMYMIPLCARRELFYEMYQYLNDDHIDTALRRIVRPL